MKLISLVFLFLLKFCAAENLLGIDLFQIDNLKKEVDKLFPNAETHSQVSEHINLNLRNEEPIVHMLEPGMEKILLSSGQKRLEIFCYKGEPHTVVSLLKTVELVLKVPKNEFFYFEGVNSSSILNQYKSQSWFSFSPWRPTSFRLNIYNFSCIGIETKETFTVQLRVRYVDLWRVLTLAGGVGIFLMAPLLAENIIFHYMTGVSIGVFGSLIVLVFLFSRLVPKRTGAIATLIGGWGLVLYIFQFLWTNCLSLLKEYQTVAIGYVVVAGLISFAVVYRWGPVTDSRSLKLVQWALQLLGLSLIFFSSQCKEFTVAIILIIVSQYNIPDSWKFKLRTLWLRRFPPKQKFLTEEEYLEQTRTETKKALDELRTYCHSPDCNAWKTMSRLKSPQRFDERFVSPGSSPGNLSLGRNKGRFAEFVEGSFHLVDDEILSYETASYNECYLRMTEDVTDWTSDEEDPQD